MRQYKRGMKTLGVLLILVGFFLLYKPFIADTKSFTKEPIVADIAFEEKSEQSEVSEIIVPRLGIDLAVTPSKIIDGYWEVSETTASHGEGSANPGENGNVVVFAHARSGMFLNLRNIKKDDEVYILTGDKKHTYKVSEIVSVYPDDITSVAPTDSEALTLFTCSGFFDEKRLIVKALPLF
jgi:LPXTG-site transpeptidase (sortase) family protein